MALLSFENSRKFFFFFTQALGIAIIALTLVHIFQYRGGFGGRSDPKHEFSWHVFFMTLGFTYFFSSALLTFRLLPLMSKQTLKIIHLILNIAILVCVSLGLAFIIDEKEASGYNTHFESIHSWMGIGAIGLLVIQIITGVIFLMPTKVSLTVRESLMPWHIKIGAAIYLLGTAALLSGFGMGDTETERLILNFTGFCIVVLCFSVLYILFDQNYKFTFRWK